MKFKDSHLKCSSLISETGMQSVGRMYPHMMLVIICLENLIYILGHIEEETKRNSPQKKNQRYATGFSILIYTPSGV